MKKNQKNILIVLLSILIILICLFYFLSPIESNRQVMLPPALPTATIKPSPQIEAKPLSKEIKKEKEVILNVFDKKYTIPISEGDSVYESMENLQKNKENNFSFDYKEYPTLGIFVDGINGVNGGGGKYWIYSVNDKEASVGVSKYILKEGDIINWELK